MEDNETVPENITDVLDAPEVEAPEIGDDPGVQLRENEPETAPEPTTEEPVEQWEPDYKFKVMDNEYEIDESLRPAINKENYDHIRELHEKAYGLDEIKKKREVEKERFSDVNQKYTKQTQALAQMGHYLENGDYTNLFKQLNVSDEKVINYALERANYQELPPEKKQEYDRQVDTNNKIYELQMQNRKLQDNQTNIAHQNRMNDVGQYISSSKMNDFVADFDRRAGQPGKFAEEVRRRGEHAWFTTGKDVPVDTLVNEVATLVGYTPAEQAAAQEQASSKPTTTSGKPTLPIVKGGAHSPAKRLPTSIADLEKMAESL